jgi:signal transduction histidine kinase
VTFEHWVADLSTNFINLAASRIDEAIDAALAHVVVLLDLDRCTLFAACSRTGELEVTHVAARPGVRPLTGTFCARAQLPYSLGVVMSGQSLVLSCMDDLPATAVVDRVTYEKFGQKANVAVPMMVDSEMQGVLGLGCTRNERTWSTQDLARICRLREVFTNALARKRAQEALDNALGFERLAGNILSSLLLAEMQKEAEVVEQALCEIARFLQVQRVTLLECLPGTMAFRNVHRWHAPGVPPAPMQFGVAELPWVSARLASNEIVSFTRLDELPDAAQTDRKTLQSLGACSQLVVPQCQNGKVIGALAIAAVYEERIWALSLIPGLRLLAGVFSSLNVRRASEAQKCAAELEAAQWRERLAHLVRVHTAGELSCALAHEFTQPLGAIENYAIAARRRIGGPAPDLAKIGALLDNIMGQASRAGDLISRLRTMVKRHDLAPRRINLKRMLGDCVAMVKMECELRGIAVRQLVAANLPTVVVDEIHIQQVILNLLRNAMEAMELIPEDAVKLMTLRVGLYDPGSVSVSVADSGTGIAQGELEQVFESFFSSKPDGLGVGLAISRRLVEAHGGKLWASHGPEGGAVFEFTLPLTLDREIDP